MIDAKLLGGVLLMGIGSALHCTLMCGPPLMLWSRSRGAGALTRALVGRGLGYALAGGTVGALGAAAFELTQLSALLRPLWMLLNLFVVLWALSLMLWAREPLWALRAVLGRRNLAPAGAGAGTAGGDWLPIRIDPPLARTGWKSMLGATGWALMPCGLLWSALTIAMLSGNAWSGAATMLVFSIATLPGLLLAGWLARVLSRRSSQRLERVGARIGGALMLAMAVSALLLAFGHPELTPICITR